MGSVPEIVNDGFTGFIVDSGGNRIKNVGVEGMVEAVRRIGEIKREDCRKRVEEKFTVEKMVEGYEEAYKEILKFKIKN